MEFRHLRYFITVVEEQSITKAADKLCMAQPPLSRQIKQLEEELGIKLFERGSRPVKVTEAGLFFYQHAKQILAQAAQATLMAQRINSVTHTIKIAYVGSLLYSLLPEIIYQFRQTYPEHDVELIELGTKDQIEALKLGKIDIGFGRLKISDPAVNQILLHKEKLMLAVHKQHYLCKYEQVGIYLSQIKDEKVFTYPTTPKPNFSTLIQNVFQDLHLIPKQVIEVREIHTALGLVSCGEGVSIIPESAHHIGMKNVIYIPIVDHETYSPVLLSRRHLDHSVYIPRLMSIIQDVMSETYP